MNGPVNFFQITDRIGTAGQPTKEQLQELPDAGFTTVVNLAMHDSDNAIREEGNIVASLGMSYIHLPVPFDAPRAHHLKKFFGVMDILKEEKVFVHCAVNARVSAFVYKYLTLKRNVSPENAKTPLLLKWEPRMDDEWKKILALQLEEIES